MNIRVITQSEVSQEFIQGMVDRMEVSYHKYGPVLAAKGKVDELACLKARIEKYETTGNTEWLMDVANFAMIIFMHEGADKFRATSSEESPGLKLQDGRVSSDRHTPVQAVQSDQVYKHRGD